MSARRTRSLRVPALVLGLALAGCSSDEDTATEPALTATVAVLSEQALWANTVCLSTTQLALTAESLGANLVYEPTSDLEVLDQYGIQLTAQVDDFNIALDGAKGSLSDPPVDLDPVATLVVTDAATDVYASLDETKAHVSDLAEAELAMDKAAELVSATVTLTSAAANALVLADGFSDLVSSASDSALDAFEQAPDCGPFFQ